MPSCYRSRDAPPAAFSASPEPAKLSARASYYHEPQRVACPGWGRFDRHALTTASRSHPCGTRLRLWRGARGPVDVVVNDFGPAKWTRRDLDLSERAGQLLGLVGPGHGIVEYQVLPK